MSENVWLDTWVEIGKRNSWIRNAYDPPFDRDSLLVCQSAEALAEWVSVDNCWCLGVGFCWDDQCWINQSEGGAEWLVIKQDVPFESISGPVMERDNPGSVLRVIKAIAASTKEECRTLDYMRNEEVLHV